MPVHTRSSILAARCLPYAPKAARESARWQQLAVFGSLGEFMASVNFPSTRWQGRCSAVDVLAWLLSYPAPG